VITDGTTHRRLKKSSISSSLWTVAGFGTGQAIRLATNIVLASLLFEEAFALMAIVTAVIQGLVMVSDIGLGPNIVQNKRGDDVRFLNTAWTIQVIRGVVLSGFAIALAWPVAAFYAANDPSAWELRWLIPIIAIGTLIEGFQSTKLKTAARHMNLGRVTLLELACQIVTAATIIGLAWAMRSVYALAIGSVVGMCLHSILSHAALRGQSNRFCWDRPAVNDIIKLGKWIFVSTILTFLALQIDKLAFGRMFSLAEVGVYAVAASIAMLGPSLLGRVQGAVAFPLYSRMLDHQQDLDSVVQQTKVPMLTLGGYVFALSVGCAETFVALAYDVRYSAAGVHIAILAAGAWFAVIDGIYGAALLASGRAQWVAAVNAVKVGSFCLMLWPASHFGGIAGAVIASDLIKLAVGLAGARSIGLRRRMPDLLFTVYSAMVGLSVLMVARTLHFENRVQLSILLVAEFMMVSLMFMPLLLRTWRALQKARK
jgi:O-antigen/teichoic acid export membrane protein